jgi:predicted nucleotidyltransferase
MDKDDYGFIRRCILSQWPDTQAIYLFGSFIEPGAAAAGDIDIALLFPPEETPERRDLPFSDAAVDLSDHFGLPVDLVNLRQVSTVFANRIISTGERILTAEELPVEEFEMLNLSFYQKLNAERHDILEAFFKTGRAVKL